MCAVLALRARLPRRTDQWRHVHVLSTTRRTSRPPFTQSNPVLSYYTKICKASYLDIKSMKEPWLASASPKVVGSFRGCYLLIDSSGCSHFHSEYLGKSCDLFATFSSRPGTAPRPATRRSPRAEHVITSACAQPLLLFSSTKRGLSPRWRHSTDATLSVSHLAGRDRSASTRGADFSVYLPTYTNKKVLHHLRKIEYCRN